ncbi:glycosyl hydrolase [Kitasatospora cystarginea]|uniref:Glycosyl hydrolase n=1 Tax=Kitasatospora cystarginea TaxID=58350 RepID=A0ABP5QGD2_9ACTN
MRLGRLALAASALLLATTASVPTGAPLSRAERHVALSSGAAQPHHTASGPDVGRAAHEVPFGAFVGSWDSYIPQIAKMARWLNGADMQVGHTYLAGNNWKDIEGEPAMLGLWTQWRQADPQRGLVLGVPMLAPSEGNLADREVTRLLARADRGEFDSHFLQLARRLVALGGGDTVLTLGWEMNGITYTHRCKPDPAAWKAYWRRIVTVMRSAPGQHFKFDFAPTRGLDAIPWTRCYPGDDVVDIIGMDSYDQPAGATFDDYVSEPYGLQDQVEFAAKHGKQVSYPEWGLFRNGDNPEFVRRMVEWMRTHDTAYQTVTDYCPHGFWECNRNPRASAVFKQLMSGSKGAGPLTGSGGATAGARPTPAPWPKPTAKPGERPGERPSGWLPGWPGSGHGVPGTRLDPWLGGPRPSAAPSGR